MMTTNGTSIDKWAETAHDQYPFYLVVIDFEGFMSFVNAHFCRTFQSFNTTRPPVTTLGNQFYDLIHENDRPNLNKALASCSLRDEAITTELRVRNGQYQWVKWEISRICKPEIMSDKFLCLGKVVAAADQQKKNVQVFEQYYLSDNTLFQVFMNYSPGLKPSGHILVVALLRNPFISITFD